jgi:hypothetical protein
VPTKRQLSRWQREERRRRIILALGLLAIVSVLGILSYGYYDSNIAIRHEPAVQVNDTVFDVDYFVKMLRVNVIEFGETDDPMSLVPMTIEQIQDSELIRQEAARPEHNIRVSDQEIDEAIRTSLTPPTEEGEEPPTLTEAEYQRRYQERLQVLGLSDADYRRVVENSLIWGKMREKIRSEVPTEAEHVYLHLILLDTEDEAKEVAARLESGEDFATLAKEVSQDEFTKEKGGELGWVPRGAFPQIDGVIFALEPNTVSEPVETPEGFYLLKVSEGPEVRTISENYREILQGYAVENWMEEKREAALRNAFLDTRRLNWVSRQFK